MMNPALVLPVPDTALNRMNDGAMISVEEAITYTELTLAAIRDGLSVKARRTDSGNRHSMMSRGIRMAYVSLRVMPQVLNRQRCSPAPIWLLMRAPAVVAKALITMISRAEILRTMLVTASGRSPKCSIARKKINQMETEIKDCTMVHPEMDSIPFSRWGRSVNARRKPYFRLSAVMLV